MDMEKVMKAYRLEISFRELRKQVHERRKAKREAVGALNDDEYDKYDSLVQDATR